MTKKRFLTLLMTLTVIISIYALVLPAQAAEYKLDKPFITTVYDDFAGNVTIRWETVYGAAKYRVFYKTGNGSWKKVFDITSNHAKESDLPTSGWKSGTVYSVTVRCVSEDGSTFTSDYDHDGIQYMYLAKPSAKWNGKDCSISWNAVPGAWGYEVCLYTRSYPLGQTYSFSGTECYYTNYTPGETYFVTVRAYGYMGGRKCYSEDCFVSNIP